MAYEETLRNISLNADASLATYTGVPGTPGAADPNWGSQYLFVKVTGAHTVGKATAGTDLVIGVMQNKPQVTGAAATVAIHGVSMVRVAAALAAGATVCADANGRAAANASNPARGVLLAAGTVIDELVPCLLLVS